MADRLPALAAAEVGAAARFRGDGVALMEQRRALDGVARAERGDDGAPPDEGEVIEMAAAIVRARVEATAPHYQPRPRGVSLKAVRERLRAKAEAECAAIARGDLYELAGDGGVATWSAAMAAAQLQASAAEAEAAEEAERAARAEEAEQVEEARAAPALAARRVPGRRSSMFADTQLEAEASAEAARGDDDELPHAPIATALSEQLMQLRRRLCEYLGELDDARVRVRLTRAGPGALYPTARWAAGFFKWYATTRKRPDTLSRWHGVEDRPFGGPPPASRVGRGAHMATNQFTIARNRLWAELWPAAPSGASTEGRKYWRFVEKHALGLFDGGGGGMAAEAARVGARTEARLLADSVSAEEAAAAGRRARVEAEAALVAATSAPLARGHLYQVGEWQMQDALLSEPFERNKAAVVGAYLPFARHTGCRPGMALSDENDRAVADRRWSVEGGAFPLTNGDLKYGRSAAGVECAFLRPVRFSQKEGGSMNVWQFPLKYYGSRTFASAQGQEYDLVWVHGDALFDYNQLYVMVTRAKASPADGGLKVTGVLWDDREFADKLKAHPKAVLLKARLGMPVSAAAVAKAEDELTKLRQEWAAA